MPYATVDGARLYFEDTGGSGPVVAFSHGNLMDGRMWQPQLEALAEEFRCISWDARLHGRTEDDGARYTYWDSARDLLGLLDHLGVRRAALVGHSQGGFLSLRAALLAPERVRALALIDSAAVAWPPEALKQMGGVADGFRQAGPEAVAPELLGLLFGQPPARPADGAGSPPDRLSGLSGEWLARWREQPRERLAEAVRVLMGVDGIADRLPEITAPALVVHGQEDRPVPLPLGVMLAETLPAALPPVVLPGAGHTPNLTHPGQVTEALTGFLRAHAG
ncbi:alpha/beta fold hydrolase [Phaeacidiphilus oryzae]|uniref:alpha/beta fold hydrolase n=1 Tax=Phaeacidiphilus oryzae TaxID=348818 RepID=UPI000560FECD|nr:alpha/beta hydrolase [Phaeacidiphilus oryzae]